MKKNIAIFIIMASAMITGCAKNDKTMGKDFLGLALERYSVRSFSDKKVEQKELDMILRAGQVAPTAVNNQPQKIYVIQSEEALAKINAVSPCIYGAPQVFLVCYDSNISWKKPGDEWPSGVMDASIVLTHMMLQAAELGIGTCWVCMFDIEKTKEAFNLPDNIEPVALMPFGYATEDAKPSPSHSEYRPIEETVNYL